MDNPDAGTIILRILLVFVLILINGFFSMSEIAIITLNDSKIDKMADEGNKKARKIADFTENSSKFLSTIQIGVTLAGFLASAFAADSFTGYITTALGLTPSSPHFRLYNSLILIAITIIMSYFTLVLGELVPKKLGMQKAEKISFAIIDVLRFFSAIFSPLVKILSVSANAVVRLLGLDPSADEEEVTEEEITESTEETASPSDETVIESSNETIDESVTAPSDDVVVAESESNVTAASEPSVDTYASGAKGSISVNLSGKSDQEIADSLLQALRITSNTTAEEYAKQFSGKPEISYSEDTWIFDWSRNKTVTDSFSKVEIKAKKDGNKIVLDKKSEIAVSIWLDDFALAKDVYDKINNYLDKIIEPEDYLKDNISIIPEFSNSSSSFSPENVTRGPVKIDVSIKIPDIAKRYNQI